MPPVLRRFQKKLYCDLTEAEVREAVTELGAVLAEIDLEISRHESLKKEMKSRLSALETKRMEISGKIIRGREERDVDVEEQADHEKGLAVQIRKDTYEVLGVRPLTDEEKQPQIPVEQPQVTEAEGGYDRANERMVEEVLATFDHEATAKIINNVNWGWPFTKRVPLSGPTAQDVRDAARGLLLDLLASPPDTVCIVKGGIIAMRRGSRLGVAFVPVHSERFP